MACERGEIDIMTKAPIVPIELDAEDERLLSQERFIVEATELICELLERDGVSRQELADRLGKTKGFVSQVLSGERNMTLRTLADLAHALGHRLHVTAASSTSSNMDATTAQRTPGRAFAALVAASGSTPGWSHLTEVAEPHLVERYRSGAEDDESWRDKAQRIARAKAVT